MLSSLQEAEGKKKPVIVCSNRVSDESLQLCQNSGTFEKMAVDSCGKHANNFHCICNVFIPLGKYAETYTRCSEKEKTARKCS